MTSELGFRQYPMPTLLFFGCRVPQKMPLTLRSARLLILSRYRSLMDTAADASLILKPLSRLSRVYESSDPDTHSLQKDPTQVSPRWQIP